MEHEHNLINKWSSFFESLLELRGQNLQSADKLSVELLKKEGLKQGENTFYI